MDRIDESRMAWQRAQADLQTALAALEKLVATQHANPQSITKAREIISQRQKTADEMLQRHITQLGKG